MKSFRSLCSAGVWMTTLAVVLVVAVPFEASAQSGPVTCNFAAGTSWSYFWEIRQREGLVINFANYQARGDVSKRVLFKGSLAQVHVPYYAGNPRFRDMTVSTSGLGAGMVNLTPAECSPGTLVNPKVCLENPETHGLAFKYVGSSQKHQECLVWSSSQLGQYNYITQWIFSDDGRIEPRIGFTGRLQIVDVGAAFAPFGTPVGPAGSNQYARNHIHNIYYRLDFDIINPTPNAFDELAFFDNSGNGCDAPFGCSVYYSNFPNESADYLINGAPFITWRMYNTAINNPFGRPVGYELEIPNWQWYGRVPDEPWAQLDIGLTQYNFCDQLATDNVVPFIDPACAGYPYTSIDQMVARAGPVDDIVVWAVSRFNHLTREEDQANMPIEYQGISARPFSWRHHSTLEP